MDPLTLDLLAARDGDRTAFAAAVRTAQAEVWRLAAHLVGRDDADDVTQDAFVRAWRALPAYRGDASGRTWLLSIARRACVDAVRAHQRRRRLHARLLAGAARDLAAPAAGTGTDLDELVAGLAPERHEAFVLTQIVGCSYEEAAAVCGVPIGTIRSRVARARDDLVVGLRAAETA